jgi:hypothetical protein
MFDNAQYIKSLVQSRHDLASALVYGRQVGQQDLRGIDGSLGVAYSYSGSPPVITAVNPNATVFTGTIPSDFMQSASRWQDVMTQEVFAVTPSGVHITIQPSAVCSTKTTPPVVTNCGLRILKGLSH